MKTCDTQFYGDKISENLLDTPEGYLVCKDVKIARTGTQSYLGQEIGDSSKFNQLVTIYRLPEDVLIDSVLASFEGKPVVDDHPSVEVSTDNHGVYAKGHVQNVRANGIYIVADLVVTDPVLINKVRTSQKREVSCGYNCSYDTYKDGYRQTDIVGNHVAIVERGRAGHKVRINDSRINTPMNKKQALLALLTHYAKDHALEEVEKITDLVMDNEDSLLAKLSKFMGKAKDESPDEEEKKAEDEEPDEEKKKMDDRLTRIEDMLSKLAADADEEEEEKKAEDEEPEMMADSDILKLLKPAIAKLPAKDQKAIAAALRGYDKSSTYAGIKASLAKDTQTPPDLSEVGKNIAAKYNPHYKESK